MKTFKEELRKIKIFLLSENFSGCSEQDRQILEFLQDSYIKLNTYYSDDISLCQGNNLKITYLIEHDVIFINSTDWIFLKAPDMDSMLKNIFSKYLNINTTVCYL